MPSNAVFGLLLVSSVSMAANAPDRQALRFTLDATKRIYQAGINFSYQTTVWTPIRCNLPVVGDPEYFLVLQPDDTGRRFIVSAKVEKPGAKTNVTFDCDEAVRFSVEVSQVAASEATLIVEFELDAGETARVRGAVEAEHKRCGDEADVRVANLREQMQREAQELFMAGMLRRMAASHDVEMARESFVIVKVAQELLVGERGFILFSVQNHTPKEIVVRDVEVLTEGDAQPMPNVVFWMPEKRVGPGYMQYAVAAFDAPEDIATVTLVVNEDGPRKIRVGDVDF